MLSRGLRQGISVIDVDGLLIEDCTLEKSLGENPQAGIDFEPNRSDQRLKGVVMRNCRLLDNVRNGIDICWCGAAPRFQACADRRPGENVPTGRCRDSLRV